MRTKLSITVKLTDGTTTTFKDDAAANFKIMDQGVFFVESNHQAKIDQIGRIIKRIEYRSTRTWIPYDKIKSIECTMWKTIDEPKEVEKWQKFKERGIDIMIQEVSFTKPGSEQPQKKGDKEETTILEKVRSK